MTCNLTFKAIERIEIYCHSLLGGVYELKLFCAFFYRRILLERGADETRKCRLGFTPLQEAQKDSEGAKLLVRFSSDCFHIITTYPRKYAKGKVRLRTALFSAIELGVSFV